MADKNKGNIFSEDFSAEEFPEKDKGRRVRRKTNAKKAVRKRKISREVYDHEWYDNLHEYSKGKVHCSCPMCSGESKTNTKKLKGKGGKPEDPVGKRIDAGWGTTNHRNGKNWSVSDRKKIEGLNYEDDE